MAHSLSYKVEDAFANIAASGSYSGAFTILTGVDNDDKIVPSVLVQVMNATKFNPYFDQWTVTCDITVKQRLDKNNTNLETIDANKEVVFSRVLANGVSLNAYTTGLGIHYFEATNQSTAVNGNILKQTITVECLVHSTE